MSDDLVTVSIDGGVADVRLNRPEKYNALSPDMFRAIVETGERLSQAKEVRAVVLSGNGRGFCAGLDMESMAGLGGGGGGVYVSVDGGWVGGASPLSLSGPRTSY